MTAPKYIIRPPKTKAEWEELKKLLLDYKHEFNDDTCFTSFEEELANLENYYAENDKLKLVAVSDPGGEVAGCVAFRSLSPGIAEMKRLYVAPKHRGHQLGRKLAEAIISAVSQRGYHKMMLDTMHEMKAAQQLYKDLGFVIIPPYDDQDITKVVCFEKSLK